MVNVRAQVKAIEQKSKASLRGITKDTSKVAIAKAKIEKAKALALASKEQTPKKEVSARGKEVAAKMAVKVATDEGGRKRSTRLPSSHMRGQRVAALGAKVAEIAAAKGLGSSESVPAPEPSKGAGEASRSYKMRPEWMANAAAIEGDIGIIQRKRSMPGEGSIGDLAHEAAAKAKKRRTA